MRGSRSHFYSALLGGLVVAVVLAVLPAVASNGDPMYVGEKNNAIRATKITSRGGLVLKTGVADRPALTLDVIPGTPPMAVNSSVRVTDLNADLLDGQHSSGFLGATAQAADSDTVDGLHANQLIRVGYGSTDDAADADGAAVTATITAPGPGLLVMSGTIDAENWTVPDKYRCLLKVDGEAVNGTEMESYIDDGDYPPDDHTRNGSENCATTGVKEVTAGAHTVTLDIEGLHTSTELRDASVWALYVPFDATGTVGGP